MGLLAEDTAMLTKHQPGVGSSTELQDFSGLTHTSTVLGKGSSCCRVESWASTKVRAAGKKDELFVKNCTEQHISVMSLLPVRNKPGCKRKPQGTWCSTPQDGCAPQRLWLTVWSTSRKYCVEASRKKANKRRVMLWWLLWAETSC